MLLRYLSVSLLSRAVMCCGILLSLMEILALLEQMTPILRRHLGVKGVLTYMVLHLPAMVQTALPLSVLIGSLVLLTQMTVSSEIAILRASGLSPAGFLRYLIPATLLIGLGGIVLEDQITPRSELALAAWWNRTDPHPEKGHGFWLHVPHGQSPLCDGEVPGAVAGASELAHVGYISRAGHELHGLDLYDRDVQGRLLRTLHAEQAEEHAGGGWQMKDIRCVSMTYRGAGEQVARTSSDQAVWPTFFLPVDMLRLSMESAPLSSGQIMQALHGRLATSTTPGYLRAALSERFLRPLSLIVMLLLAMPVIYIPPRAGLRSWLPVWCLGGGLLFIIVQGMFRAMGNAGLLPAFIATAPGLIIFSLAACTALLRNEDK